MRASPPVSSAHCSSYHSLETCSTVLTARTLFRKAGSDTRWREALVVSGVTVAGILAALVAIEIAGDAVTVRRERMLLLLAGLGVTVVALPWRLAVAAGCALALVWVVSYAAFTEIPDRHFLVTPVSATAGGSAYYGSPYRPNQLTEGLLVTIVLAVAVAAAVIARRRPGWAHRLAGPSAEPDPQAEGSPTRPRLRIALLVAGALVAMLALFPNLHAAVYQRPLSQLEPNWDVQVSLAWASFASVQDLAPGKDYFYAYGGQWLFNEFPLGDLWHWLGAVAIASIAGAGLWRLGPAQGRATRAFACVAFLPLFSVWAGASWRYALPFAVAVLYASIGPAQHRRPTWGHLGLAVVLVFAGFYEGSNVLYAVSGGVFVLTGELVSGRVPLRPVADVLRRVAVDALPLLAAIALVPLTWVTTSSVEGYWRLYTGFSEVASASAHDQTQLSALRDDYMSFASLNMFWVTMPVLLLVVGLFHSARPNPRSVAASRILLAGTGVSLFIVLKHLIRPLEDQTLIVPIIALTWAAAMLWQARHLAVVAAAGACAGVSASVYEQTDAVTNYLDSARDLPKRTGDNLSLFGEGAAIDRMSRKRFARERFPNWPVEQAAASELDRAMRNSRDRSFAVLGDAQYLYAFYAQRPPYHNQLYDASRRVEQEAMVEALERQDPAYVFWRKDYAQDQVPQYVRDPLVFRYVIDHFVPAQGGPINDVLQRRRPGEAINASYWRDRIGDTIDLGYVPYSSDALDADECSSGDDCVTYAVLEGHPRDKGESPAMRIAGPGGSFGVTLKARPGKRGYPVRLDRMWFHALLGGPPTVTSQSGGWSARIVRLRTGDDLY